MVAGLASQGAAVTRTSALLHRSAMWPRGATTTASSASTTAALPANQGRSVRAPNVSVCRSDRNADELKPGVPGHRLDHSLADHPSA